MHPLAAIAIGWLAAATIAAPIVGRRLRTATARTCPCGDHR